MVILAEHFRKTVYVGVVFVRQSAGSDTLSEGCHIFEGAVFSQVVPNGVIGSRAAVHAQNLSQ